MEDLSYFLSIPQAAMLCAALIEFALIAYTLGRTTTSSIRNSFIVAIGLHAFFLLTSAISGSLRILNKNNDIVHEMTLLFGYQTWIHLCWFFIFLMPLGYLYFYYTLANKTIDTSFKLIAFISSMVAFSSLFTEKIIVDGEWNIPIMGFVFLPCFMYGIMVCAQTWWRSKTQIERKRNGLILLAIFIPVLLYGFLDLLLDKVAGVLLFNTMYVHALNGILAPIMIGLAITKYGLLKVDLKYAAEGLFLNSDDPVILIRPDKSIARANPIAQKMFKLPETSQPEQKITIKKIIPNFDENKQNFTTNIILNETKYIYSCSNSKVKIGNEVRGQILLMRDITKEIELNSMKTEFTSTVSHELRTPLTSILGFARIIQKRVVEVIIPKLTFETKKEARAIKQVQRNLDVVVTEGQRLTKLINDVLDISKMEAGKLEWKFQRLQLTDILPHIIADMTPLIEEKNLSFITNIDENLPEIIADPTRIAQVIDNILVNALKFTNNGRIQLDVYHKKESIILSFIDTGIGIDEHDLDKIFQKYQQVGDVLTDKPTGTGLGLPISREIIDSHGGKITVKSIVNVGSEFKVFLPLPVSARKKAETIPLSKVISQWKQTSKPLTNEANNTILIIEDEAHIRELLRQALEPMGYEINEAKDGVEGLEIIRKQLPSLVIVDVMMPKLNGFEVVTILKNNPQTLNLPIIMLTVVDEVQRGYGLGINKYLKKPIDPEKIVDEVQKVLNNKTASTLTLLLGKPGYGAPYLEQMLSQQGQTIVSAQDIQEFQQQLQEITPDLILVEAEAFSYEEVHTALNTITLKSKLLVKFISNS